MTYVILAKERKENFTTYFYQTNVSQNVSSFTSFFDSQRFPVVPGFILSLLRRSLVEVLYLVQHSLG